MGNTPTATIQDKKISFVLLSKFPFSYSNPSARLKNLKLGKKWVFLKNSLLSTVDYMCTSLLRKDFLNFLVGII